MEAEETLTRKGTDKENWKETLGGYFSAAALGVNRPPDHLKAQAQPYILPSRRPPIQAAPTSNHLPNQVTFPPLES